ncbi:hypothetical protein D3C81_2287470 [compost metagenome]
MPLPVMLNDSATVNPPPRRTVAPLATVVEPAVVPSALAWLAIRVPPVRLVAPV